MNDKRMLVTGGAGYIGSFIVKKLLDLGNEVTVIDNLERGHQKLVDRRANFEKIDIKDGALLKNLFQNNKFDAVFHFAGLISVGESEENPEIYKKNNVEGSKNLFNSAYDIGKVAKFIFSSSAAVYGNPTIIPIPEDHPKNPTSVYGKTKLEVEKFLEEFVNKNEKLSFTALRYFNACGASQDGSIGEMHSPETHIIPLAIKSILENREFNLFGNDYDTQDGTCVRDYIHVLDLVDAHLLALEKINNEKGGYFYNVGTGRGYSNLEVIQMIEKVNGIKIKLVVKERRAGDADKLIADPIKIEEELGFKPKYSDLETIIKTAWEWHNRSKKF